MARAQQWDWKAAAEGAFGTRLLWANVPLAGLNASDNIPIGPDCIHLHHPVSLQNIKVTHVPAKGEAGYISGPDEEGENKTVVKVSEKLRSGPLIQGFPMLYRVLPKSKEEIKETHYQHNSWQNCQNNSLKVLGWRGQGILLVNIHIEPGGTKSLFEKTKIGLCQYQFIGVKQDCRYYAYRRDAKQKHVDVGSRLDRI